MTATFTDTHLHLDFEQLGDELEAVLERARAAGVKRFITVGTTLERSRKCVELATAHDDIWAAVGVHPSDSTELAAPDGTVDQMVVDQLKELAVHPRTVAVGEIGLDFFRDTNPPEDAQRAAFEAQAALSVAAGRPVIIHSRAAEEASLAPLGEHAVRVRDADGRQEPGVVHCFTGSLEYAEQVLELGYLIGFTAPVGYPKNDDLREVVQRVPLEKLLLETDAPFLPPADKRGQRNEPAYLAETARVVAELKDVSISDLAAATEANTDRVFGLS